MEELVLANKGKIARTLNVRVCLCIGVNRQVSLPPALEVITCNLMPAAPRLILSLLPRNSGQIIRVVFPSGPVVYQSDPNQDPCSQHQLNEIHSLPRPRAPTSTSQTMRGGRPKPRAPLKLGLHPLYSAPPPGPVAPTVPILAAHALKTIRDTLSCRSTTTFSRTLFSSPAVSLFFFFFFFFPWRVSLQWNRNRV